jgi:hypothetical protein
MQCIQFSVGNLGKNAFGNGYNFIQAFLGGGGGAPTLSITTLSIMTFSIMTISITTLSITLK